MMEEIRSGRMIIGLVLIIIGVLVLLHTTGALDLGETFRWLPSLLVLVGLWQLVAGRLRRITGPAVLMMAGAIIQLAVLGLLTVEVMSRWWPVIIIAIGLSIILERMRPGRDRVPAASSDTVRILTLRGDTEHRSRTEALRGGQVTSLLGDAVLDLRVVTVTDPPAQLDVLVGLGDTRIVVPPGWSVSNQVSVVLGSKKDRRRHRDGKDSGSPDLVITGTVLLGDLTVDD